MLEDQNHDESAQAALSPDSDAAAEAATETPEEAPSAEPTITVSRRTAPRRAAPSVTSQPAAEPDDSSAASEQRVTSAAGGATGATTTSTRTRGRGGAGKSRAATRTESVPEAAADSPEATSEGTGAADGEIAEPQTPDPSTVAETTEDAAPRTRSSSRNRGRSGSRADSASASTGVVFQVPDASQGAAKPSTPETESDADETETEVEVEVDDAEASADAESAEDKPARRRRRRGGRRRRRGGGGGGGGGGSDQDARDPDDEKADRDDLDGEERTETPDSSEPKDPDDQGDQDAQTDQEGQNGQGGGNRTSGSRRRRRRRRSDDPGPNGSGSDDPENTVTKVRSGRSPEDEITSLAGSTRLEAKKQRRREGREAGRRKAPIVSEAEFLARRESVERTMVVRQGEDLTQIAVLEDKVLVEHYVARKSQTSMIGNVYLGKVQNVLPSMEAAFIDIGKGRNAVLYAGEVNWRAVGAKEGQPRKIEQVLKSGQSILVQVSKDPIGQKGARLTGQISLPGRFLVYVPDGTTSGISRKLPDTERSRLKSLLKQIVPSSAGVIVRTAAEGASEDELTRDVERLKTLWESIEKKVAKGQAPLLLHGEPDLTLKVVRDVFTEDFAKLVVSGDEAWGLVHEYVTTMAPDLVERLVHHAEDEADVFAAHRIDEQLAKALDQKVWLPSGGSLIIDRTEAMTVVDVNTGKFTGSGGNLEETVTKNNLEAAEEVVRQLRLRDIGGIIVVDFIDMVLENNRDLVLRRLIECLGRDRTRHQVAEVTSLGLVQMTRKRIGTGLLESFSEPCPHCKGRGHTVSAEPVDPPSGAEESRRGRGQGGKGRNAGSSSGGRAPKVEEAAPTRQGPDPAMLAAMAGHDKSAEGDGEEKAEPVAEGSVEPAKAPATRTRSGSSRRTGAQKAAASPAAAMTDAPQDTSASAATTVAAGAPSTQSPVASTTTRSRRSTRKPAGGASGQADTTDPAIAPHESAATGDPGAEPSAEPAERDGDPAGDS